jgi:cell division protein FtsZ
VQGISDLILVPGLVNLDFADVRTIMSSMGLAMMGTGTGKGEHRALDAAQKAVASPLLDDTSIQGARGILINVTGGSDLSIHEVEEAARIVQEAAHEDANIIFGAVIDPNMGDEVRMTVIATGFSEKKETQGGNGKVLDLPRVPRPSPAAGVGAGVGVGAGAGSWRRRAGEMRAEGEGALGDADLEVPAFLRRQAD